MKYLSLFSGLGECTLALTQPDFECIGFYESRKEYLPRLSTLYPNIPNYGNFRNINAIPSRSCDLLVVNIPNKYIKPKYELNITTDPYFQIFEYINQFIKLKKIPFSIIRVKPSILRIPKLFRNALQVLLECDINELPHRYIDDFFIGHNNTAISWRIFSYESFNLPQRKNTLFIFICHSEAARFRDKSYRVLFDSRLADSPYKITNKQEHSEGIEDTGSEEIMEYYSFGCQNFLDVIRANKAPRFYPLDKFITIDVTKKKLYLLNNNDWDQLCGLPRGYSMGITASKRATAIGASLCVPCLQYIGNQLKNFVLS